MRLEALLVTKPLRRICNTTGYELDPKSWTNYATF